MTCAIALLHEDTMYVAADTCCSDTRSIQSLAYKKVFARDDMLFAFSGTIRSGQFLQYRLEIPSFVGWDLDRYVCVDLFNAIREGLKEEGLTPDKSGEEPSMSFLLGWRKRIYTIECNAQAVWTPLPYEAIGSGSPVARGALHATTGLLKDPEERIVRALQAASDNDPYVRPPYSLISMNQGDRYGFTQHKPLLGI